MTVKDFLEEDKKLYERENKLLGEINKIHDKRADLSTALNDEKRSTIWAELKGKALAGPKGDVWIFKGLKGNKGDYTAEFIRTRPKELPAELDRSLEHVLRWITLNNYTLIEVPVHDQTLEGYISENKKLHDQLREKYKETQALRDRCQKLEDTLSKGKKEDYVRFLKAYKIVLDNGTYTFKSLRKEAFDEHKSWWVTCEYEQPGIKPSVFGVELSRYLNIAALPGAQLEPV